MSVTAIWTVHCDQCLRWDERDVGDTKAEASDRARLRGWLVSKDRTICNRCLASLAAPEDDGEAP